MGGRPQLRDAVTFAQAAQAAVLSRHYQQHAARLLSISDTTLQPRTSTLQLLFSVFLTPHIHSFLYVVSNNLFNTASLNDNIIFITTCLHDD